MSRMHALGSLSLGLVLAAVVGLVGPEARANRRGGSDYDRATELHNARHFDEAAAAFIASYQAGYREETSAYNAACALARAGRPDDAFAWLAKARDAGFDLEQYLDDDIDLRSLRSDLRFAALRTDVLGSRSSKREREAQRAVERYDSIASDKKAPAAKFDENGRELLRLGRYDEATRAFLATAAREENKATAIYNAACARSLAGDKSAALQLLQKAVEEGFANPKHLDADDDLDNIRHEPAFAAIHALAEELDLPSYPSQGRDRDAKSLSEWIQALPRIAGAVRRHPELGQAWFNLGFAGLATRHLAQSAPAFQKAAELGYRKSTSMYNVACSFALTGRVDDAFAWLDKAFASGFTNWGLVSSDSDLDNLRGDPRFRRVLDIARAHERQARNDD